MLIFALSSKLKNPLKKYLDQESDPDILVGGNEFSGCVKRHLLYAYKETHYSFVGNGGCHAIFIMENLVISIYVFWVCFGFFCWAAQQGSPYKRKCP